MVGDGGMMRPMAYGDVADGLPFDADYCDLVCSQVAWLYFGNKVGVLQEVIRVLKPDGIAKIDADEVRPGLPPEYGRLVEIWEDGKLVPFGDYLRRFGMGLVPAREGQYLRIGQAERFGAVVWGARGGVRWPQRPGWPSRGWAPFGRPPVSSRTAGGAGPRVGRAAVFRDESHPCEEESPRDRRVDWLFRLGY